MRAFVVTAPGEGAVQEVADPVAGAGQVVVDVHRAGVCGTDAEFWAGDMAYLRSGHARYPMRLGHEWSGTVSATGRDVDESWLGARPGRPRCPAAAAPSCSAPGPSGCSPPASREPTAPRFISWATPRPAWSSPAPSGSPAAGRARTCRVGILAGSQGLAGAVARYAGGDVDPRPLVAATVGLDRVGEVLAGWRPGTAGAGPKVHVDPRS